MSRTPVVDVHTHVYPPFYVDLLKSRQKIPYIREVPDSEIARLVILPNEDDPSTPSTARGRPVGPVYWNIERKIKFMDDHGIDISVISLANPWLDFLDADQAAATAKQLNDNVESECNRFPGRLFGFGTLPLSGSTDNVCNEIKRLSQMPRMRGVVMGTTGLGNGLDDPALDPMWTALEETGQTIFLHPHYGLPKGVYGSRADDYGHVLPLALGFPLETTIAVTRMYLSGVFDRHPALQVLLAHSGGTLPFLAGRIESCIQHDAHMMKDPKIQAMRNIWDVLKTNIWLDAVIYGEPGVKMAVDVSTAERVMFGTDHPFFPPLTGDDSSWESANSNMAAIRASMEDDLAHAILGGNAARALRLS